MRLDEIDFVEMWYQGDEDEDEDLMCSPAILARRASESWINVPPVEVTRIIRELKLNTLMT